MVKHFSITLSTFILRIIHATHLKEHDVFLLSCTIYHTAYSNRTFFSSLHDRNLQYSSTLLNSLVNTNDMYYSLLDREDGALEVGVWVWIWYIRIVGTAL